MDILSIMFLFATYVTNQVQMYAILLLNSKVLLANHLLMSMQNENIVSISYLFLFLLFFFFLIFFLSLKISNNCALSKNKPMQSNKQSIHTNVVYVCVCVCLCVYACVCVLSFFKNPGFYCKNKKHHNLGEKKTIFFLHSFQTYSVCRWYFWLWL